MMKKIIYFISITAVFMACEDPYATYKEDYRKALANVDIKCHEGDTEIFVKCTLDDDELCIYDGANNYEFKYGYATRSITSSPSFSTGDSSALLGRFGIIEFFILGNPNNDELSIWLPLGPPELSEVDYLEKLFSKKELVYNDLNDSSEVIIKYQLLEKMKFGTGSNAYNNSSEFGTQEDSYFRIENVVKEKDDFTITYQFEFRFKCTLYYDPQFKNDVWRELDNGILKGEITIDK